MLSLFSLLLSLLLLLILFWFESILFCWLLLLHWDIVFIRSICGIKGSNSWWWWLICWWLKSTDANGDKDEEDNDNEDVDDKLVGVDDSDVGDVEHEFDNDCCCCCWFEGVFDEVDEINDMRLLWLLLFLINDWLDVKLGAVVLLYGDVVVVVKKFEFRWLSAEVVVRLLVVEVVVVGIVVLVVVAEYVLVLIEYYIYIYLFV